MKDFLQTPGRREFLRTLGGGAMGLALAGTGHSAGTKPMRGVFPIGGTPVNESDVIDLECLQNQVKFCNRYKVHGFAWPQIVSGWASLSEKERMDGAEALLAAGKGGQTAIVIGVQDKDGNLDKSTSYAKHAAKNGADAIISLPPDKADDQALIEYYKAIGKATDLPLFVQSQGTMSVDLIVEMAKQIPTMKCVKDEAGNPLARVAQIRERTNDKLAVFSGNGVRTMIDEMTLGFSGHCPTVVLRLLRRCIRSLARGKTRRGVRHVWPAAGVQHHYRCWELSSGHARSIQGEHQDTRQYRRRWRWRSGGRRWPWRRWSRRGGCA